MHVNAPYLLYRCNLYKSFQMQYVLCRALCLIRACLKVNARGLLHELIRAAVISEHMGNAALFLMCKADA